jgi:flagellar basal body-associated protein FliL
MKRSRLIALAVALVVAIAAVSVALAGNGSHAAKAHTTFIKKSHTLKKAAAETPDPGETAGAESSSALENDGVDAGGDHQCPPNCAAGEQP